MEALSSQSAPKVVVKRIVRADPERVFDAWTNPEIMNKWYVGGKGHSKSTVDLRIGGAFTNEMFVENSTCNATTEGTLKSYMHQGEYLEIDRPNRLVFTWNSPSVQNTKVRIDLRKVDGGTEVTITHELQSPNGCKGHEEGWTFALGNLAALLG